MIKPTKLINTIVDVGSQLASKATKGADEVTEQVVENLPKAEGELLQAYRGIRPTRLFENFSDFATDFATNLEARKDALPPALYQKIKAATDAGDFSISKILAEHYSGLNSCKTVAEAKEMFPELKVFNLDFEGEMAGIIRSVVPEELCAKVSKLSSRDEQVAMLNEYFDKTITKRAQHWDSYPEFKKVQDSVIDEIIEGKYKGQKVDFVHGALSYKEPLRYSLIHVQNRDEFILNILKENLINGVPLSKITVNTPDGREINMGKFQLHAKFETLDGKLLKFLKRSEATAQEFASLSRMDSHQISSAIMTETWRTSGLRRDLGNATAYKKDWSLIKPVWQKTMFPETTYYPTQKLIDAYLLEAFKAGKRTAPSNNPFAKHIEADGLDKSRIMTLKYLYKISKDLYPDNPILRHPDFLAFKSQFDVDGMAAAIEGLEERYKNIFFKMFWDDSRKARFAQALNENIEIAGRNIEISDNILVKAMDSVFEAMD